MTNEEMERAIEFLLKNQADFEARMTRLEAIQAATSQQIRESAAETNQQISETNQQIAETNQQIRELSVRQDRTQVQLDHLSSVVATLAEATQRNSADIDVLVKLVGSVIEGRNGKTGS
ncbi:MAG TPA: hypothetical protein VGB76_15535 [Pyrinomonadaceae bacterium]|jgi:chromosome segregation ATPase